jgi:CelD/BcsL family acetyltransferase involved in cellulose biosynthesis
MTTVSGELSAEVLRGPEGLDALREPWDGLFAELGVRRYFHSWDWYHCWLHALAEQPAQACFVAVRRGARLVAVVPLEPRARRSPLGEVRVLELPAHGHMPLADIACHPDVDPRALLAAVTAALARSGIGWDLLQFENVMDESVLARIDSRVRSRVQREMVKTCDHITCDRPWEEYAATLSTNFRSNLNKARNKLAREPAVEFEIAHEPGAIQAMLPDVLQIEASGWKGAAGTAILNDPRLMDFYSRQIEAFALRGGVMLSRLRVDGHTISGEYCMVDSQTLYVIKLAYDENVARLAPGNSLLERMFRSIHGQYGLRHINLVGSPPWFAQWNPVRVPVWRIQIRGPGLRARAHWAVRLLRARVGRLLRRIRALASRSAKP